MTDQGSHQDAFVLAIARELRQVDGLFVGTNQAEVALAAYLARRLWAPKLRFWSSGTPLIDPSQDEYTIGRRGYENELVESRRTSFAQARAFDDGLRAPVAFAGGLQVDRKGNANLVGIRGEEGGWRLRGPGSAGLPSLTGLAKRFYLGVPNHDPRALVERCSELSVIGDPSMRRSLGLEPNALVAVITPLARFEPGLDGLVLTELADGVALDLVAERTGFPIAPAEQVDVREPASEEETAAIAALREAISRNRGGGGER